jgi:glycolate oxidase iron-sulfur subunit
MRTAFTAEQLADPHVADAERQLRTCIHCGFCTATCPTYTLLGDERDSPRGRIGLIQHMLESKAPPTKETVLHLDRCLSCLGCRTACPSGVDYSALIDVARAHIEKTYQRPLMERLFRSFVLFVLMRPGVFSVLSTAAHVAAPFLPGKLGTMAKKGRVRRRPALPAPIAETSAAARRVLLVPGCVQRALAPSIDAAAVRVLARQDVKVETLKTVECCGSLAYHLGKIDITKTYARRLIEAFEEASKTGDVDAVLITASGCGSFLKDMSRVFADDSAWHARAQAFAEKVKDFTELAAPPPPPSAFALRASADKSAAPPPRAGEEKNGVRNLLVAYHPPCSLQHGQRIHGKGEKLLAAAGFRLAPIPDAHMCCGSAGSYSVLQPEIADALRARKLDSIRTTGATVIASANLGCLTHLSGDIPTVHIAELLDWAQGGPKPPM